MATINEDLRSKIDAFTGDITALVHQAALEAVRSALSGGAALSGAAAAPSTKPVVKATAPAKAAPPAKPAAAAAAKKPAPAAVAPRPKAAAPAAAPASAKKPVKAAPVSKAAPAKRPAGAKRPPAELAKLVERLGEYIKGNPGLGVEAIGKALATPTSDLTLPVKKLLAAKRIRFEGHKRATKYFPA